MQKILISFKVHGVFPGARRAGGGRATTPFLRALGAPVFNRQQNRKRWRDLGRGEIEAFIQALTTEAGVADWQVVQARDALEVYYEQFRSIALEPAQTMGAQADLTHKRNKF